MCSNTRLVVRLANFHTILKNAYPTAATRLKETFRMDIEKYHARADDQDKTLIGIYLAPLSANTVDKREYCEKLFDNNSLQTQAVQNMLHMILPA